MTMKFGRGRVQGWGFIFKRPEHLNWLDVDFGSPPFKYNHTTYRSDIAHSENRPIPSGHENLLHQQNYSAEINVKRVSRHHHQFEFKCFVVDNVIMGG